MQAYADQRLALVRLAFLVTGDREAAEEVVQDAFVSTLAAWDRVRDAAPYLRACVVNGSRGWHRRRALERRHDTPEVASDTGSPDELWDVLARLNARQRAAVVLRFYEGLPDEQIAEILGCRTPTVRSTIHRALRALRKEIE